MRGESQRYQRHHDGGYRIHQFVPPGDAVFLGLLAVVFQIADVAGERTERHLLGFDQQDVEQLAADIVRPAAFGFAFGLDCGIAYQAAFGVFQQPVVGVYGGALGGNGFGEFEVAAVAPDFDALQAVVGQHFGHIDHAVGLFDPQAVGGGRCLRGRWQGTAEIADQRLRQPKEHLLHEPFPRLVNPDEIFHRAKVR